MIILVLNSGSSSLKFQVINTSSEHLLIKGIVDGIGLPTCKFDYEYENKNVYKNMGGYEKDTNCYEKNSNQVTCPDHNEAVSIVLKTISETVGLDKIQAIGHRVVHGGEFYKEATLIDDDVIKKIDELKDLAPLHNPPNLAGILACKKLLPTLKQVAVFDTAFHESMPEHAYLYAIPYEYYEKFKIRKYGFHGTSHKYVSIQAKKFLNMEKCNLVTCHLGNGSSITAIQDGISIDTSMGFTPLQGILMGTRSGNIDPEIIVFLSKKLGKTDSEILSILNKQSGLKGICGFSDVRTIHEKALAGDKKCILALDILSYKLGKHIGSYMVVLPNVDAIVFTAGIGENAYYIRQRACDELVNFGVLIDKKKNEENKEIDISAPNSKVKILVIHTNEELMIAKETEELLKDH
ncbi:MAG: acetate kinase [Candidatus Woesearchaeota archaeon]